MEEYESLGAFLEHVSLVMDNDCRQSGDKVTIMTIHAAKGLEFPLVFLAGWEEGIFPSQRSLDEGGLASLEEERRLAYVAITRARRPRDHPPRRQPPHLRPMDQQHPLPLRRRATQGPYRGRNHHDRRREPVARPVERARRPLRPRCAPVARARLAKGSHFTLSREREREGPAKREGEGKPRPLRPPPIEARASAVSLGNKGRDDLSVGQRVFHGKFGYGTIEAIEGNKLEIDFEHAGRKRVLDSFVST